MVIAALSHLKDINMYQFSLKNLIIIIFMTKKYFWSKHFLSKELHLVWTVHSLVLLSFHIISFVQIIAFLKLNYFIIDYRKWLAMYTLQFTDIFTFLQVIRWPSVHSLFFIHIYIHIFSGINVILGILDTKKHAQNAIAC